jgi:hypothetical protein
VTDPIQPIGPRRDLPPVSPAQRRNRRLDEDQRKEREQRQNPRREPRREPPEDGEHLIDIEA